MAPNVRPQAQMEPQQQVVSGVPDISSSIRDRLCDKLQQAHVLQMSFMYKLSD